MKPKCIGIVGGAGPLAGALLLERIFTLCGQNYGCYRDGDFPKVILISFPFSEMLCPQMDIAQLRQELSDCLEQLRKNGASVLAIACNTLHAFLDQEAESNDLVHLPRTVADHINAEDPPLVFCTSTSMRFGLHKQFFPCTYPEAELQNEIDEIIDLVLKGFERSIILKKLNGVIERQQENSVILGCTELSLFSTQLSFNQKNIIDPLELVALRILERSFESSSL